MADVEVLIPTWNQAERLRRALESLRAQTLPAPVCVVDNGSTDHTASMLARDFPEVRRLGLPENRGFGRAVNEGAATSRARLIVLMNNDARADTEFIARALAVHDRTGAEMVAACMRRPDGAIESLGVEVDRSLIAYDVLFGHPFDDADRSAPEPLAPSGGAALFVRDAFLTAGGYDPGFFAYLEDVDLGIRMRAMGMRCAAAPDAFVWHEHSGSLGARTAAKNRLMGRSRGYLAWKYAPALPLTARVRGAFIDAIVYAGKAIVDRDLGGPRGRLAAARGLRGRARPDPAPELRGVPLGSVSVATSLRRRLARRSA